MARAARLFPSVTSIRTARRPSDLENAEHPTVKHRYIACHAFMNIDASHPEWVGPGFNQSGLGSESQDISSLTCKTANLIVMVAIGIGEQPNWSVESPFENLTRFLKLATLLVCG